MSACFRVRPRTHRTNHQHDGSAAEFPRKSAEYLSNILPKILYDYSLTLAAWFFCSCAMIFFISSSASLFVSVRSAERNVRWNASDLLPTGTQSEERRVGKECRSRGAP